MQEKELECLQGTVKKITYRNEVNCYTVAEVKCGKDIHIAVGIMPFLAEGDVAEFYGNFTVHASYGKQFSVESFERKAPENAAAILRYLSAGAIKGIGPATAVKIVEKFGNDTLNIISENPKALASISGISINKAMAIHAEYEKQHGVRDIMLLLAKFKVTPDRCIGIYKKFGSNSVEVIKGNPYSLCEDGIDFSFELAENIAVDFGIAADSEMRVAAGIEYVIRKNLSNGHTCLPRNKVVEVACNLLSVKESVVEVACDRLIDSFNLLSREKDGKEFLSLPEYFAAEQYIAARLLSVKDYISKTVTVDETEIGVVEAKMKIEFEEKQRQAVLEAFESGILVLTGGPGTGKTTTLNAIIKLFENRRMNIELAAPTGRAAKRITELCGREAKTIHRLLEVEWGDDNKRKFSRNEKNPLSCDAIIVDEASMIDAMLFSDLLKALPLSCRIILVGDSNQLPSIGAGNVLGDILQSEVFPSIELKKVFRQASKSKIITNAHAIINDQPAEFSDKSSDCFFITRSDKFSVTDTVIDLISQRLPKAYGANPLTDIQVLCPSRMLETGTVNLNNLLQNRLNPLKKGDSQLFYQGVSLRKGDKVMQIKNNYDIEYRYDSGEIGLGVFNGDIGYITDIDARAGIVNVRFDDKTVTYFPDDLNQLELAYAVTVHKSQGSEYDYVILPLFDVPQKLKYRNLLYTAVTRAKKMLVIVGREEIWYGMAANASKTKRFTRLKDFLISGNKNGYI